MLLDEVEEPSSVDLWSHRRDAVGIRTGQFRFRYVSTLLLHAVIRENIDDAETVQLSTIRS